MDLNFTIPHSCFPNCAINGNDQLVMLRQPEASERLTIDYSTLFLGTQHSFLCNCGYNGCRGVILGFNFLPVYFQDYYLEHNAISGEVLSKLKLIYADETGRPSQ